MNQLEKQNNIPKIIYRNLPVVTTSVMAKQYGVADVRIRQNFNSNKERFEEGKHFFKINGNDLKNLKAGSSLKLLPEKTTVLTLWTERGAARHAKMINTEKAWEVFEVMEDTYFKVRQFSNHYIEATTKGERLSDVVSVLKSSIEMANLCGLTGNMAIISANNATLKITGKNPLELLGSTHLLSNDQQLYLTPTELGHVLDTPLSAQKINAKLAKMGLQNCRQAMKKHKRWEPTKKGSKYSVLMDTGKASGEGTPVQQLKWKKEVVELLNK